MKLLLLFILIISCKSEISVDMDHSLNHEELEGIQLFPIVSSLTDPRSPYSMSIEVDWSRKLIYSGRHDANECLSVYSFVDEQNITFLYELTNTSDPAQSFGYCRNIKLYDNGTKLLVASDVGNRLMRYDMGANPENINLWNSQIPDITSENNGGRYKAIEHVTTDGMTTRIYQSVLYGWFDLSLNEGTGTFTKNAEYVSSNGNNATFFDIANSRASFKVFGLNQDFQITDLASNDNLITTLSESNDINENTWVADSTSDGSKHVSAGKIITFFDSSSGTPVITKKFHVDMMRAGKVVEYNGVDYFFGISGNRKIWVWDISDISNPIVLTKTDLTDKGINTGEGYGIDINLSLKRAVITTTDSTFAILNTDEFTPVIKQPIELRHLSVSDVSAAEGANALVSVSLDQEFDEEISFDYITIDGTATVGDGDYTSVSGSAVIPQGQTSVMISIPILVDGTADSGESFTLELRNIKFAIVDSRVSTITINE